MRAAREGIQDWCAGQTLSDIKTDPLLMAKIKEANRRRCGLEAPVRRRPIPLSVKTRLGYDRIVIEDWIQTLLAENPAVISVHGRTLKQGYKGDADWDAIARAAAIVKKSQTLILGNGDLQTMEQVYRRVCESGVDGVLLARSAQGNPWVFRGKDRVKKALRQGLSFMSGEAPVCLNDRFKIVAEHCQYFEKSAAMTNFVAMRVAVADGSSEPRR
jgi:tRNA-dihydrouridine synthase